MSGPPQPYRTSLCVREHLEDSQGSGCQFQKPPRHTAASEAWRFYFFLNCLPFLPEGKEKQDTETWDVGFQTQGGGTPSSSWESLMTGLSHASPNRTEACGGAEVSARGWGAGGGGHTCTSSNSGSELHRQGGPDVQEQPDSAGRAGRGEWRPVRLPLPRLGFVNGRGWFRACPRRHGLRLAISKMLSVHPKSYLHVQDGDVTHASTRELWPDRISEGSQLCTFHWPALGIKWSYRSVFSGSEMLRENLGVSGTCSFWFSSCRRGPESLHFLQAPRDTEGADLKTSPESWGWAMKAREVPNPRLPLPALSHVLEARLAVFTGLL